MRPQVQELRANGRDPYAYGWPRTHTTVQLQQQYADLPAGEQLDDVEVCYYTTHTNK